MESLTKRMHSKHKHCNTGSNYAFDFLCHHFSTQAPLAYEMRSTALLFKYFRYKSYKFLRPFIIRQLTSLDFCTWNPRCTFFLEHKSSFLDITCFMKNILNNSNPKWLTYYVHNSCTLLNVNVCDTNNFVLKRHNSSIK